MVSAQTIYGWRKHFGTLEPADVRRLRHLEQENGRLKKMVADRDLELDVLKEITRKNGRRTRAPAAGRLRGDAAARAPRSQWPDRRSATSRGSSLGTRTVAAAPDVGGAVPAVRLSHDPGSSSSARGMSSARSGCTGSGVRKVSRCRRSGHADAWPPVGHGRWRRR
jgi:hypothetical protein